MLKLPLGLEYLLINDKKGEEIVCPECGSKHIEEGRGDLICKECGLVLEDHVLKQISERIFERNIQQEHTAYFYKVNDTFFNPSEARNRKKYFRINKINKWVSCEQNTYNVIFAQTSNFKKYFGSAVVKDLNSLVFWGYKRGLLKGRGIKSIVSGSLYLVLRMHKVPVFIYEVANALKKEYNDDRYTKQFVVKASQIVLKEIYNVIKEKVDDNLEKVIKDVKEVLMPSIPSIRYIDVYFRKLGIEKDEYIIKFNNLSQTIKMNPGLMAAGIYFFNIKGVFDEETRSNISRKINEYVGSNEINQDTLAEIFDVSTVTLRTYYRMLMDLWERS